MVLSHVTHRVALGTAGVEAVWLQLRYCHVLRNEMAHFCTDLQTYIMFEVLETAWQAFMTQLQVSMLLQSAQVCMLHSDRMCYILPMLCVFRMLLCLSPFAPPEGSACHAVRILGRVLYSMNTGQACKLIQHQLCVQLYEQQLWWPSICTSLAGYKTVFAVQ